MYTTIRANDELRLFNAAQNYDLVDEMAGQTLSRFLTLEKPILNPQNSDSVQLAQST